MTLLEVLVALAMLGMGAAAFAAEFGQEMHSIRLARSRERAIGEATALMTRAALWSNAELRARVGRRRVNGYAMTIDPIDASLFDVVVVDSKDSAAILHSAFYRRDTSAIAR